MEHRKRYSRAEQEIVIGMYRESGLTLTDFCEIEGLEVPRVERWLRHRATGAGGSPSIESGAPRLMEVEPRIPFPVIGQQSGKYRMGFANGSWLEIEGEIEVAAVRDLAEILREGKC